MSRASRIKPLSDTEIKNAKPKDKTYRLYDGKGLCVRISKSGSKHWEYRFKNPSTEKEDTLIIGEYPFVTLSQARLIHTDLVAKVANGINPKESSDSQLFRDVFETWWQRWQETRSEKYAIQVKRAIENNCMAVLGRMDIKDIKPIHITQSLQPFEDRGVLEYLHRTRSALNQMFQFCASRGLCEINPVMMVTREAFKRPKSSQHRSLDIRELYQLVDFIGITNCAPSTKYCIEFILRNISRVQEAAQAKWEEIDTEKWIWTIPAKRMKMRREHVVPLSRQSIEILKKLKAEHPDSKYIFASEGPNGHINKETPRIALNKAGIDTTIHGFRHLASTILNETLLFKPDVIEVALAHVGKDQIRATYNNAQYTEKRREMMQWWSDFIDMCDTERNNLKALKRFNII